MLGRTIATGSPIEQAWIVPQAKRALVRFSGKPGLSVVDWNRSLQVLSTDELQTDGTAIAAISPSGTAFALLTDGGIESWRIDATGLARLWRADFSGDQNNPTSLAVSDDGELVAAALPGRVVTAQSGFVSTIAEMESFGAMSFAHNSHAFLLGREKSNAVLLFDALPAQGNVEIQWEPVDTEKLTGLGFSGDNALIAIASATDNGGQIRLFNASDGRVKVAFETRSTPNGVYRAQGNAVFQMTTSAKATSTILDGDSAEPRLVTVAGQEISND